MLKSILAAASVAAFLFAGPAAAISQHTDASAVVKMQDRVGDKPMIVAQAAPIAATTTTATPTTPTIIVPPTNDAIVTPDGKGGVTVSVGSAAGEVWKWALLAFGGILTTIGVAYVKKWMDMLGVKMTADQEAELSRALQDGFNQAAEQGDKLVAGTLAIKVDDPLAAAAITYAMAQKPALLKSLGLDPNDGNTVKLLQAKLATLKVDPTTPTAIQTVAGTASPSGVPVGADGPIAQQIKSKAASSQA